MISPKPYQGLYNELPPNTLLVCGRRALMKFGRGFLSDCAYPLDETQKRWEAVGDQLYNELKEWMRNKNLSDQDVTRVKGYLQSFRVSDRDVDGKLNRTELEDLLYRIKKLSKNIDVGQLLSEVDTSNTGFITLTNFLDAAFGRSSSNLAALLREGSSIPPEEMKRRRGRPKKMLTTRAQCESRKRSLFQRKKKHR
jgi:predicted XRE-type DNA-binding protein